MDKEPLDLEPIKADAASVSKFRSSMRTMPEARICDKHVYSLIKEVERLRTENGRLRLKVLRALLEPSPVVYPEAGFGSSPWERGE